MVTHFYKLFNMIISSDIFLTQQCSGGSGEFFIKSNVRNILKCWSQITKYFKALLNAWV